MSFHDGPGLEAPGHFGLETSEEELETSVFPNTAGQCGVGADSVRGLLRPEWRGVLSFDGMQRLDGVWTSTRWS